MRCNVVGNTIYVALSRSNLESLLRRLDDAKCPEKALVRDSHNLQLVVHAEEDAEHYHSAQPRQGGEVQ